MDGSGSNLTIDFNDASFDDAGVQDQPIPGGVDVDVVFPITDDPSVVARGADNRDDINNPAQAVALMPSDSVASMMDEFVFEFDNDENDDGDTTTTDQGLKITTKADGPSNQILELNLEGTFENLHDGGTLDLYVNQGTANNPDFASITLGMSNSSEGTSGSVVGGDMNGGNMGGGNDIAEIDVDASLQIQGMYKGGSGYDSLRLIDGSVRSDNGAIVDFIAGTEGGNSAYVLPLSTQSSDVLFEIAEWESLQLTNKSDLIMIGSTTGGNLTDTYDTAYWNPGASNSMLKLQTGYTDGGAADIVKVNADSDLYMSFEFANDSDVGIEANFYASRGGDSYVDIESIGGSSKESPTIDVEVEQTGGSGMTIDYLEATSNKDVIVNDSNIGVMVDLGGSSGEADIFEGSSSSQNDVLDARVAHDLEFAEVAGGQISVKSGTDVNAHVSDVDYIMVRDRAQGEETTQADINAYDTTKVNLEDARDNAQDALNVHDTQQGVLNEIASTKASAAATAESESTDAADNASAHAAGRASLVEATNVTSKSLSDHDAQQGVLDGIASTKASAAATAASDAATAESESTDAADNASAHAAGRAGLVQAQSDASAALSGADNPNDLVVGGTAEQKLDGTGGITDFNDDGLVTLADVEAYIAARLDEDGEAFFADQGLDAEALLALTDTETEALKTAALDAGITDTEGLDDFINDAPVLVSQTDIDDYQALVDASSAATKAVSDHDAQQGVLDGIASAKASAAAIAASDAAAAESESTDAADNVSAHAAARGALENAHFEAVKAVTDHDAQQDVLDGIASTKASASTLAASESTAAADNVSAHADGRSALESELTKASQDLVSFSANPRPVLTDVDFYEDMSHLNGTQLVDGLGAGASDAYGVGYDVVTSAQVNEFADDDDLRVYYEGDHDDFVDTDDDMTYSDGVFTMSSGDSSRGSTWEGEIDSQYGPGQEPGFYVEISGKKVAVTFDDEKASWKVDSSALKVAEDASSNIDMSSIADNEQFASDVMARFGLKPAAPQQSTSEGTSGNAGNAGQQVNNSKSNFVIDSTDNTVTGEMMTIADYWYPGQRYDMIDLPNDITGRVDVWNQTLQANYSDDHSYTDLIIGILDKTTNKIVDQNDDNDPSTSDYTDTLAVQLADSPDHRSGVDSFISFNVQAGHEYAVMVGDLGESYPDVADRSFDGGGYDLFAVSDVGGANEKVVINSNNTSNNTPNHSFSDDIYLNASEEAIDELLDNGSVSDKAFNFSFYTKMDLVADTGNVTVNVKLQEEGGNQFSIDADDIDVGVESFYNVADDAGAAVTSSSAAGEFVKIDDADDIALGNGGDDTYVVGDDGGDIYGGIALEYGNIAVRGGLTGSIDAVNFNSVDSVSELTFERGKLRNEDDGSSLFIGDGSGNETVLFDNYNEYLDFRRVEYLTVEDGANNDEIYEIVTNSNDNIEDWDNEIYVANGGSMDVELGGIDYVVGSDNADNFNVSLSDMMSAGSGTVNLSNVTSDDTINVTDAGSYISTEDEAALEAVLAQGVAAGGGEVEFSVSGGDVSIKVDSLNIDEIYTLNQWEA